MDFPIIDLDTAADLPHTIDIACRDVGFFAITGHGVPPDVIEHAWSAAERFFDLPLADKLALESTTADYPYGYLPMSHEALGASSGDEAPPDLNESFSISPPPRPEVAAKGGFALTKRVWPDQPGDFRVAWSKYYEHMEVLASRLMRVFAVALGLRESFFDDKIDRHLSALRALNYIRPRRFHRRRGRFVPVSTPTMERSRFSCRAKARVASRSWPPTRVGSQCPQCRAASSSTWAT